MISQLGVPRVRLAEYILRNRHLPEFAGFRQGQFRTANRMWHQWLGFASADGRAYRCKIGNSWQRRRIETPWQTEGAEPTSSDLSLVHVAKLSAGTF